MQRAKVAGATAVVGALCAAVFASSPAVAVDHAAPCPGVKIRTASGCTSLAAAGRQIGAIVDRFVDDNDLRAALTRVDLGDRTIARVAAGESIAGVRADLRMHFRIGAMAVPHLITILLQLQDKGRLSLDDPVSNWLPDLPDADRVTLRMLANSTSGYADWLQGNPAFLDALYADVFRQWQTRELMEIALAFPAVCEPGACFSYAHTNYVILAKVIEKITGRPAAKLLRRRVLRPLGMGETAISGLPAIPPPVLHAYTVDRGPYEDSTFWSPSWTFAKSLIMTGTIGDVIRSAKAVGTGALISRRAALERIAPTTAGLPGFSRSLYFGLGIVVVNTWQIQNPELNGYTAIMAYLPSRRIALALAVTRGKRPPPPERTTASACSRRSRNT